MLLTTLAVALAPLFSLQAAAEGAKVIVNDNPETWTVEYPRIIRPFIVQYRQCLNVSDRRVTGEANFEAQHRSDVPRCAKQREKAQISATAEMAGAKTRLDPRELDAVFDTIGFIHVARGRDLDDQFKQRVAATQAATTQYDADKPKGLVLELVDASVVKSRAEIAGQAEGAAQKRAVN